MSTCYYHVCQLNVVILGRLHQCFRVELVRKVEMAEAILAQLRAPGRLERDRGLAGLQAALVPGDGQTIVTGVGAGLAAVTPHSELSWEEKVGYLAAARLLVGGAPGHAPPPAQACAAAWLCDSEARVRTGAGELLGALCRARGVAVWDAERGRVLQLVTENLQRGEGREAGLEDKLGAAAVYHDTAGWRCLETSLVCLQRMVEGLEDKAVHCWKPELLKLLLSCLSHTNRFVRETGYQLLAALLTTSSQPGTVEPMEVEQAVEAVEGGAELAGDPLAQHGALLAPQLAAGLSDNWSQVRLAASVATRALLTGLAEGRRAALYPTLLPRLCLNRYYLAEGVRIHSQQTWRQVAGQQGKQLVETHILHTVQYYTAATQADNHAVREAACQCIAELAAKLDREVVRPHAPALLNTLLVCFQDDSWPVRDHACVAAGSFLAAFPAEGRPALSAFLPLFLKNLADPIASVRQGAALALANTVRAYGEDALQPVLEEVVAGLAGVEQQPQESERYGSWEAGPAQFGVAKKVRDNDPALHEDQTLYSCGSLAPKMRSGGGGCTDAKFRKE